MYRNNPYARLANKELKDSRGGSLFAQAKFSSKLFFSLSIPLFLVPSLKVSFHFGCGPYRGGYLRPCTAISPSLIKLQNNGMGGGLFLPKKR